MIREVELAKVCDIRSGGTPSRLKKEYFGGKIPWAKIGDLEGSEYVVETEEYISEAGLRAIRGRMFPAGTLLFAIYGSMGRMAFAGTELSTNQAILGIQPLANNQIDLRYLFHYLSRRVADLQADGRGVTQKNLSVTYLRNLKVPLPPFKEQCRIAAILDRADIIRYKREQILTLADNFLKSVFLEMFGDPLKNPFGWPLGTIRNLVSEVKYGTSQKASTQKKSYKILRMGNITYSGQLDIRDLKYVDIEPELADKYTVQKDDILFNRTNSKELVGKTTVFDLEEPFAYAGYLVRARVNEHADPYYISGFLNSDYGKKILQSICKSIVGMANINAQEFQNIPILIPPIERQKEYRKVLESVKKQTRKWQTALNESELLFASLSQQAFQGKL